ncbi:MAG: proline dehydrogenase family protein [Thaumarchaeota archaeon]|nr:proline dehydrogenase family protein [Nitrososphaerota archaeon]
MGLGQGLLLRVAKRWIAGTDSASAIKEALKANQRRMSVVLNYLGEEISDPSIADAHMREYLSVQKAISDSGIKGCVSVKLTQFGLLTDETGAIKRLAEVIGRSEALGQMLWIDMESSRVLEKTLQIYLDVLPSHPMVGLALQSYMRRSAKDLETILGKGAKIRLVKGAYKEPPDLVFNNRAEATENYSKLMETLFKKGDDFVIATHDPKLIDQAKELANSGKARFEFQMLKGIQDGLKDKLVQAGYKVGEYLPYGSQWYAYSKRRISEHPSNILLLLRSLF